MNINRMAPGANLRGRLILLTSLLALNTAHAQLSVSDNKSAGTLANTLSGPGVTVSNATLNCPGNANGTFSGGTGVLGIGSGILLTSGDASSVVNPASYFENTDNNAPGDVDLTKLVFPH